MADTAIEWADRVWNPTTGCDRVSPGCDHCYALTMAKRLKGMGSAKYQRDGDPRTSGPGFLAQHHETVIGEPLRWRKPQRIFVNSMSDLFHDNIPDVFIARVWSVMKRCPEHTFMVLTKRHARMRALLSSDEFREMVFSFGGVSRDDANGHLEHYRQWPVPNVWLGVSAENQHWLNIRYDALRETPAAVRFVSAEPLLGPIAFEFESYYEPGHSNCSGLVSPAHEPACGREPGRHWGIDWVIVGGESGHGARPMHPDWVRGLRDQCVDANVAFLFKQWGEWAPGNHRDPTLSGQVSIPYRPGCPDPYPLGWVRRVGKKAAGRELDGQTWDQYPEAVS